MAKLLVLFTAAIFFVYGLVFVFFPHEAIQFVVQESISTSSGATDVRATYGGMSVGIGFVLYFFVYKPKNLDTGLLAVFTLLFSMACGRGVGMIVDGSPNNFMYIYLALELIASAIALVLLLRPDSTN